jgi:spore germination protein GerM
MPKKRRRRRQIGLFLAGAAAAAAIFLAGATAYFWAHQPAPRPVIKVYFFQGEKIAAVERPLKPDAPALQQAMAQLLAGPLPAEKAQGLVTQIPAGARLLQARVKDETAILDFNRRLEGYGGGTARLEGMINQIVFTATEVPGVTKAWIWVEGEKEIILGGEGLVLDRPLGRGDLPY